MNEARVLAPELFNDIHQDTPRRWKCSETGNVKRGVVSKLIHAMVALLSDAASRVTGLVLLFSVALQSLFEIQLANLGLK